MGLSGNKIPKYVWVVCSKQHEALYVAESKEFVIKYASTKLGCEWEELVNQGYYVNKYINNHEVVVLQRASCKKYI